MTKDAVPKLGTSQIVFEQNCRMVQSPIGEIKFATLFIRRDIDNVFGTFAFSPGFLEYKVPFGKRLFGRFEGSEACIAI